MEPAITVRRRRGAAKAAAVVGVLAVLVGGALAFRYLFNRPGERAVNLVPANAVFVMTLDTTPSPGQAPTFLRIQKALEAEGVTKEAEGALTEAMDKSPVAKEVRPYLGHSFAMAQLPAPNGRTLEDTPPVMLLHVKDAGKVREYLAKEGGRQKVGGLDVYHLRGMGSSAAIIEEYLVVAKRPDQLQQIAAVDEGRAPSVAGLPAYQAARASLPEDANLMFFVSPAGLKEFSAQAKTMGVSSLPGIEWMALSVTLQDAGIAVDYHVPMDQAREPMLRAMAQIQPVDLKMLDRLPSGAYGVMAVSQPGMYWDPVQQTLRGDADTARAMDEGIREFEKSTGMSIPGDILPGLKGNLWLAVYPDARGAGKGVDGVIVMDDANGASPDALAAKVRAWVEQTSRREGGKPVTFTSTERNGATIWALDARSEEQMRSGLAEAVGGPPAPRHSTEIDPRTGEARVTIERPVVPAPQDGARDMIANKTVAYAQVGRAVIMASSREMLERAVDSFSGSDGPLGAQPAYQGMRQAALAGSQSVMLVDLAGILESLRPQIEEAMRDGPEGIAADDVLRLFGESASGMVASGRYDGKVSRGAFFLPLDYGRFIHLLGASFKSMNPTGPGAETLSRHGTPAPRALARR
jgi:hypothetical protein